MPFMIHPVLSRTSQLIGCYVEVFGVSIILLSASWVGYTCVDMVLGHGEVETCTPPFQLAYCGPTRVNKTSALAKWPQLKFCLHRTCCCYLETLKASQMAVVMVLRIECA